MNPMFSTHLESIIAESKLVFPANLFFKPRLDQARKIFKPGQETLCIHGFPLLIWGFLIFLVRFHDTTDIFQAISVGEVCDSFVFKVSRKNYNINFKNAHPKKKIHKNCSNAIV